MDKEYICNVANEIVKQLFGTGMSIVLSWAPENFRAIAYQEMPALTFNVDGLIFSGRVIVALNAGNYYNIILINHAGEIAASHEDISFDELVNTLDADIERPTNMSESEYAKLAWNDSLRKIITE